MTSNAKKRCLLIVYLQDHQLSRYPDQLARFEFLKKNFFVSSVIASANAGVHGEEASEFFATKSVLAFSLALARSLRRHPRNYDFIYVIGLPAIIAFALVEPPVPVIAYAPTHFEQHFGVTVGGSWKQRLAGWLKQALFFSGLRRIALTMAISRQLAALYEPLSRRVVMLPMGVDLDLYRGLDQPPPAPRPAGPRFNIIYPGSGGPGRGMDLLIDCARLLQRDGQKVTFHLIGCNDATVAAALQGAPQLAEFLRVYPLMPHPQIVQMYGEMDAGLSLLENNKFYAACPPQKIFEYMAAGLPVLCNEIATHTDFVGDNAVVVEWSAEALYAGVLVLCTRSPALSAAVQRQMGGMDAYSFAGIEQEFVQTIHQTLS